MSPFAPWNLPFSADLSTSPSCSRSDPLPSRRDAALTHLRNLPAADLYIWTDSSVPQSHGQGGLGVVTRCMKFRCFIILSYSAGPLSSSLSSEMLAIKQALLWCIQHLQSCCFSSVLLLSDSRSSLSYLFTHPQFLLPESYWTTWSFLDHFSSTVKLSL